MAADVHANTPLSVREFRTHWAGQFQTLAKLMQCSDDKKTGPETVLAASWGSQGTSSERWALHLDTLLSDLQIGFLLEAPSRCVAYGS